LISETWLAFLSDLQDKHLNFDFFTGPNLPIYGAYPPQWLQYFWRENIYGKESSWLSLLDFGNESKEIPLQYVWGLNFIVRKEAFMLSGGFHPDNIPNKYQHFQGDGESGLIAKANKLGYKALYCPQLMVYHQVGQERLSKIYFGKRAYYQGVCDSYTQLRKQHIKNSSWYSDNDNTEVKLDKRNWKGRLVDQFPIVNSIVKLVKRPRNQTYEKSDLLLNPEFSDILQYTKAQYKLGYEFHQNAFHTNPLVKAWLVREDYWDYTLPK